MMNETFFCYLQTLWKLAILKKLQNETFEDSCFWVFSDAVKTVEVEERFSSSVCISLSQFWAVGLQLSEVPSLLSSSSSSNATSLLSFDKGAKFDDALWEEEPWGSSSSSLTSSLQKEIMAVLFSVSLPFFRFCSGNIAILSLLLYAFFFTAIKKSSFHCSVAFVCSYQDGQGGFVGRTGVWRPLHHLRVETFGSCHLVAGNDAATRS